MVMTTEKKSGVIREYQDHDNDTGSAEVQVALLTSRIKELADHFAVHKKDHASRRGLLMMVSRRRKLLAYVKKHHIESYRSLITKLGIRK